MDSTAVNSNLENKENVPEPIDYTVRILHVRPEIDRDTEFLLSYSAKENRGRRFVEEMFAEAFKTAHPKWIIKKVTVEEKK